MSQIKFVVELPSKLHHCLNFRLIKKKKTVPLEANYEQCANGAAISVKVNVCTRAKDTTKAIQIRELR